MGGRFAPQAGAPLTAQPIEIEALEVGNDRKKRSTERQRSARRGAVGRFASRLEFARARVIRLRRLRRLPLGPKAAHRVALRYGTTSPGSRGVRDPVD
jgi:hypothetical protein